MITIIAIQGYVYVLDFIQLATFQEFELDESKKQYFYQLDNNRSYFSIQLDKSEESIKFQANIVFDEKQIKLATLQSILIKM